MSFAEVVFNLPINHAYTYRIAGEIENLSPGMRVLVPFGKRTITGIVVKIISKTSITSLKDIIDVLDEQPLLSSEMLDLTEWIAEYYFASWGQTVQLALPKMIDLEEKEIIHLKKVDVEIKLTERQRELYLIIGSNPDNSKDFYRRKFGRGSFYYFLGVLEKQGLIYREKQIRKARVGALLKKFVIISSDYNKRKEEHEDYLKFIKDRPEVDKYIAKNSGEHVLKSDFLKQTKITPATLQKMERYKLCDIVEQQVDRKVEIKYKEKKKKIILTNEQTSVINKILSQIEQGTFSTFLLHGVTGSGKTQVYIEVLKHTLKKGKTAIILIPEISLTPQTVSRFTSAFSEEIAVFHSKMSAGERFDSWMGCYKGKVKIVVGPRSALFAPLKDIGLIVVDEEHVTTYKQTDAAPRYHARDTAVYRAKMNNALVILGSATPSLESYHNAQKGKYQLLEIPNRIQNIKMPDVHIVDMKIKRGRADQASPLFSKILIDKISDRLEKKEQIILLQNRRGYSSFMQCKECGFIPVCPNCEVTLTYHSYNENLQCHLCGHHQAGFNDCLVCGGKQIVYKGIGTQRIQNELHQIFPQAGILRMDMDTTRGKNMHDTILRSFGEGAADILLGTQMIAKGLDFSNVTLVGVISADVGLALPDFRAAERVFQLLTQVSGRAGRGEKPGEVVVQSFMYTHYAIQFAKNHDFIGFYNEEMQHRRNFKYPPFVKFIQVLVSTAKMSEAINTARALSIDINKQAKKYCQVIGPAPAVIPKMKNMYRWQVVLKLNFSTDPAGINTKSVLRKIIEPYIKQKKSDIRVIVDVDAISLS
jgi:primosomal protein N' (replication factor Y)